MLTTAPVIFICGPTGSGKTAVSVKLAQAFSGEVINADAYQLYKGLTIATAKITEDEMQGVPHHLLSVHDPKDHVNVTDFLQSATEVMTPISTHQQAVMKRTIAAVKSRGHVPIVVGGSNFYVESLIFDNQLLQSTEMDTNTDTESNEKDPDLSSLSAPELHSLLADVSPAAAAILHPHDTRRVLRSLEKHYRRRYVRGRSSINSNNSGTSDVNERPTTTVIDRLQTCSETDEHRDGDGDGVCESVSHVRYPGSIVVQVMCSSHTEQSSKLSARVEDMVKQGLVSEARLLWQYLQSPYSSWEEFSSPAAVNGTGENDFNDLKYTGCCRGVPDCKDDVGAGANVDNSSSIISRAGKAGGLAEAIGFKELLPFFRAEDGARNVLLKAISDVKHSTVQYAKRQATWLRNRLIPLCDRRGIRVFGYCPASSTASVSALSDRESGRGGDAISSLDNLVAAIFSHNHSTAPASNYNISNHNPSSEEDRIIRKRKIFHCDACGGEQNFQGKDQYDIHIKSKKHRKRIASRRKKEQRDEEIKN